MLKIGKLFWIVLWAAVSFASEIQFSAQVDQTNISSDDTVTLKFDIRGDSTKLMTEPEFNAPGFRIVNEFNSVSMSSRYDSSTGRLTTVNSQQISKVLKPLKSGQLKISEIQLKAGGKAFRVPDILIQVTQGRPQRPGQNQAIPTQRGSLAQNQKGTDVGAFVRAEVDRDTAYKGEQILVSYYLYHRAKIFNIQVEKYPILNGFLREDLEIPVMGQHLDSEQVSFKGALYERSLLARYAAYPLEEGKLSIDSMALKFNYYSSQRNPQMDEDDPFLGFFQQLSPKVGSSQSDRIAIQVSPLPFEGKPASYSGGIGDFTVTSAVDKYEVHANEAVTLVVDVEGKGNFAALQNPNIKWPDGIELYETKGKVVKGKGGKGAKVYEFLLIPRVPGKVAIPAVEFSFFDPVKKSYYTKTAASIDLTVLEPVGGAAARVIGKPLSTPSSIPSSSKSKKLELHGLKPPETQAAQESGIPVWRFLYWGGLLELVFLVGLIGMDQLRSGFRKSKNRRFRPHRLSSETWDHLHQVSRSFQEAPWKEVSSGYDSLNELVFEVLDQTFGLGARSYSRTDLKNVLLQEKGVSTTLWDRIVSFFEFYDLVRFAISAGGMTETKARTDFPKWVKEVESIVRILERVRSEPSYSNAPQL